MTRRAWIGVWVFLAVAAAGCGCPWAKRPTLRAYMVHHAEGAFEAINAEFERQTGIRVDASYACRRSVLEIANENKDGDIFVNSGLENFRKVKDGGLSTGPIYNAGELLPAIAVAKGNPKKITGLADLAKPGVRVCLGSDKGCMGQVTRQLLEKNQLADKLAPNVVAREGSEMAIALSVDGQKVDAAIVWLPTILEAGADKVEAVAIPPEQNVTEPIGLFVLDGGKNKEGAKKFAAFIQGPAARKVLAEAGLRREK